MIGRFGNRGEAGKLKIENLKDRSREETPSLLLSEICFVGVIDIYILLLLLFFNYSWVGPCSLKKETLLKLWVFPVQALQIQYEFFFFFF